MDVYGINEFLGIAQHRDGVFLNTGTAIDARNMDTSDGNLSVAKGYIRKSSNAIPGTDKVLRLIPVDEKHVLAVTQSAIYHGDYTAWGEVPLYSFAEPLGADIQVDYVQAQINLDVVVIVATGTQQMVKITFGETITAGLFGSGQYLYESTIAGYADKILELAGEMSKPVMDSLSLSGGIYIDGTLIPANAISPTYLQLTVEPSVEVKAGLTAKVRDTLPLGTVMGYNNFPMLFIKSALSGDALVQVMTDGGLYINDVFTTVVRPLDSFDTVLYYETEPTTPPTAGQSVTVKTSTFIDGEYVDKVLYSSTVESYGVKWLASLSAALDDATQEKVEKEGSVYIGEDENPVKIVKCAAQGFILDSEPESGSPESKEAKAIVDIYQSKITSYDTNAILTLQANMSLDAQIKLTVDGGLYIDGIYMDAEVLTENTVVLLKKPETAPLIGDSAKIRGGASDAKCNYVVMHYSRLFAAGDPENPTRLYWSTIPGDGRTIEHWLIVSASVDLSGGYVEVGNNANDPIIGLCALSNQIIIFKRYSIYRLYGDRPSYYTVERIERFTENMSNASVAIKADIPYWLTKSGIKYFDGVGVQLLDNGDNLLRTFLETVKSVSACKGFVGREKLYFSCRTGPGTYDDALIVYDMARSTYMVRDGFNIGDIAAFDGIIHMLNDGRYLYEFDKGDKYDGKAIAAYWNTQPTDLGAKYFKKQLKEILFRATGKTIIFEITNGNSKATERRVVQGEEMIEIPLHSEECRRFSIKISNEAGSAFTIRGGMQVLYEGSVRPR